MDYKAFALLNPYTNEYRTFECPYVEAYSYITPYACGLCYDSSIDDYKVILIYKSFYAVCYISKNYWMKETRVHSKVEALDEMSREYCSQGISVSGCVFWSLDSKINQLVCRNSMIIYFDVKSNELKELLKPNFIGENQLFCLIL